jgi:hypothetical protein
MENEATQGWWEMLNQVPSNTGEINYKLKKILVD